MVKNELVAALVEEYPGISKEDMAAVVDALFCSMAEALMGGKAIEVRGMGRFTIKERRPLKARNPRTEESVFVPTRWVVHFRPSESLMRRIQP
jgi:integration host factor subunit beta